MLFVILIEVYQNTKELRVGLRVVVPVFYAAMLINRPAAAAAAAAHPKNLWFLWARCCQILDAIERQFLSCVRHVERRTKQQVCQQLKIWPQTRAYATATLSTLQ